MAHCTDVRQAFVGRVCADPSLLRHIAELVQPVEALKDTTDSIPQPCSNVGRGQSGDGYDSGKAPWHIRFVGPLRKFFKRLGKRGSQAINRIVSKIRLCFNVARPITRKIFKAIKIGFLWTVRAIVDPQGEIREILDEAERSKCMKAMEVIGVVAVATVGALIISFGTAGTGPFGVGAATVGMAAASAAVRRQPCHRAGL